MTVDDIKLLCCIKCGGDLNIEKSAVVDDLVVFGLLYCPSCHRYYPILNTVGVFFDEDVLADFLTQEELALIEAHGLGKALPERRPERQTDKSVSSHHDSVVAVAHNWEYQWDKVYAWDAKQLNGDDMFNEAFFWTFIPLDPKILREKVVYIACGGRGREAFHSAKYSPRKIIVNEIGSEIYSIRTLLGDRNSSLLLIRSDVCRSPLKPSVADVCICDHALQHVADHGKGYAEISKALKPGGLVGICVYSHENNFLLTRLVEPAKIILTKLPLPIVRLLALAPAVAIFAAIRLVYMPLERLAPLVAKRLPLHDHMIFWSNNAFEVVWLSCFDLLHAPISYHFHRWEVEALALNQGQAIQKLVLTHGTTWSMIAQRPS